MCKMNEIYNSRRLGNILVFIIIFQIKFKYLD